MEINQKQQQQQQQQGFDDQEKEFMSFMNFTDEMYEVIQDTEERGNQLHSHCMASMDNVGQSYRMVHGYISLLVCIAGIFMNILIVMVLTRKEMRTPINRMLTGLAIADIIVMVEYIPFTLHMYVFDLPEEAQFSYTWAVYVLFHSHLTQILHTINIQLTISMSIWRYLALKGAGKSSSGHLTLARCNLAILAAYICPIIICIPNYLTFSIYHRERLYLRSPYDVIFKRQEVESMAKFMKLCEHTGEILNIPIVCENAVVTHNWYTVGLSRLAKANGESLHKINFWIFSVCVKIIPCIVLTTFMVWLVKTLYAAKRRHKMLQGQKSIIVPPSAATPTLNNHQNSNGCCNAERGRRATDGSIEKRARAVEDNGAANLALVGDKEQKEHGVVQQKTSENNNGFIHHVQQQQQQAITSASNSDLTGAGHAADNGDNGHEKHYLLSEDRLNGSCKNSILRTSSLRTPTKPRASENHLSLAIQPEQVTVVSQLSPSKPKRMSMRKSSVAAGKKSGKRHTDRTSKLLIAVLCLFLITEIPQGIMALLSGIYGEQFFRNCYNTWAEVWDILALINSAINFILYCFMSKQFRLQFRSLLSIENFWKCSSRSRKTSGPSQL